MEQPYFNRNFPRIHFPFYGGWTQYTPVIPKFYWDVYSAEQRMKQLCMNFDKLEHYVEYMAETFNEWNLEFTEEIEAEISAMWEEVHSGYEDALNKWLINDLPNIISIATNMVFFGLSADGEHFTAYIPESWQSIVFDAGYDYSDKNRYGRLILEMYVTDTFQINNKPTELIWEAN